MMQERRSHHFPVIEHGKRTHSDVYCELAGSTLQTVTLGDQLCLYDPSLSDANPNSPVSLRVPDLHRTFDYGYPLFLHTVASLATLITYQDRLFGATVCDLGSGSTGILGTTAYLLGAKQVRFVDLDPQLGDSIRAFLEINKLTTSPFKTIPGDLGEYERFASQLNGITVGIANIGSGWMEYSETPNVDRLALKAACTSRKLHTFIAGGYYHYPFYLQPDDTISEQTSAVNMIGKMMQYGFSVSSGVNLRGDTHVPATFVGIR